MEKLIFTPSEDDLRHAYTLHVKQAKWKRAFLLIGFATCVGIVLASLDGFDDMDETTGLIVGMALWGAALAVILQILLPRFWIPRYSRKIYKQQKETKHFFPPSMGGIGTSTWPTPCNGFIISFDESPLANAGARGTTGPPTIARGTISQIGCMISSPDDSNTSGNGKGTESPSIANRSSIGSLFFKMN